MLRHNRAATMAEGDFVKRFWGNVFGKLMAIDACHLFRKLKRKRRKERSCSSCWVAWGRSNDCSRTTRTFSLSSVCGLSGWKVDTRQYFVLLCCLLCDTRAAAAGGT